MCITKTRQLSLTLLLIGLMLFNNACQPLEDSTATHTLNIHFFDLKAYFQEEIDRHQQQQTKASKKISLDGEVEQQPLDSIDFSEELSVFVKSAINRPAWLDKYQVDSTFQKDELTNIRYKALSDRLKTRQLSITFNNGQVTEIEIENLLETVIATTRQQLRYIPANGYSIHNSQDIAFSKSQELGIEVEFESL